LVLVVEAVERAVESELPDLLDTLAWAYFGVGKDALALEFSLASLEAKPIHQSVSAETRVKRLSSAVAKV
jgi:hypothetical protein